MEMNPSVFAPRPQRTQSIDIVKPMQSRQPSSSSSACSLDEQTCGQASFEIQGIMRQRLGMIGSTCRQYSNNPTFFSVFDDNFEDMDPSEEVAMESDDLPLANELCATMPCGDWTPSLFEPLDDFSPPERVSNPIVLDSQFGDQQASGFASGSFVTASTPLQLSRSLSMKTPSSSLRQPSASQQQQQQQQQHSPSSPMAVPRAPSVAPHVSYFNAPVENDDGFWPRLSVSC